MDVDTSSNMLMRPNGLSGTMTSLYGTILHSTQKSLLSYAVNGCLLDHYEGIQFHQHTLDTSYTVVSREIMALNVKVDYNLTRFGDITILEGYNQYGFETRIKWFLDQSTLLRGEGRFRRRAYRENDSQDYYEFSSFLRLDKFFNSGTTIRNQLEAGMHRYTGHFDLVNAALFGLRSRVAQSLGERWGMFFEAHKRWLIKDPPRFSGQKDILQKDTLTVSDALQNKTDFDRVFLDDEYKYSSYGILLTTKYIVHYPDIIQFETFLVRRKYDGSLTSLYWYLPPKGWNEWEWNISLTVSYKPVFCAKYLHPSFGIYHRAVHASESFLSFDSSGVSFRLELY